MKDQREKRESTRGREIRVFELIENEDMVRQYWLRLIKVVPWFFEQVDRNGKKYREFDSEACIISHKSFRYFARNFIYINTSRFQFLNWKQYKLFN